MAGQHRCRSGQLSVQSRAGLPVRPCRNVEGAARPSLCCFRSRRRPLRLGSRVVARALSPIVEPAVLPPRRLPFRRALPEGPTTVAARVRERTSHMGSRCGSGKYDRTSQISYVRVPEKPHGLGMPRSALSRLGASSARRLAVSCDPPRIARGSAGLGAPDGRLRPREQPSGGVVGLPRLLLRVGD